MRALFYSGFTKNAYAFEAYNRNIIQALFFVRISRQPHTKFHLTVDAYKNSPLGKHFFVRIGSVHDTTPWSTK